MASLALGPEIVGECHLEHAVAVGVLEEPAALDAVDILPPVEVIAHREAHHPLSREVQPLAAYQVAPIPMVTNGVNRRAPRYSSPVP